MPIVSTSSQSLDYCIMMTVIARSSSPEHLITLEGVPTTEMLGRDCQQVLRLHDPDTPWHLHRRFTLDCINWKA